MVNLASSVSRLRLSRDESELYTRLFVECDSRGCGVVGGKVAGDLFHSSGLSDEVLFEIWRVGDPNDSGELDFAAFCICCRLIAHAQSRGIASIAPGGNLSSSVIEGTKLYLSVPDILPRFGMSRRDEPAVSYVVTPEDLERYKYQFACLDANSDGYVDGEDARDFYMSQGGLSQDVLMKLWSLADLDADGRLNLKEFSIMQQLANVGRETNCPPPLKLPRDLELFASSFGANGSTHFTSTNDGFCHSYTTPPGSSLHNFKIQPSELSKLSHSDLIYVTELILKRIKDVCAGERDVGTKSKANIAELETKLKEESKVLESVMNEYRTLCGDSDVLSRKKFLMEQKLKLVHEQSEEIRKEVQDLKAQNAAMISAIEHNNTELSSLQQTRQDYARRLEEDSLLLRLEEREFAELANHLEQLKREKNILIQKNNAIKESLSQSENATKTMMRSIEHEQSKITSVNTKRINVLEDKVKASNEIFKLLDTPKHDGAPEETPLVYTNTNRSDLDSKGIRVTNVSLKVGGESSI